MIYKVQYTSDGNRTLVIRHLENAKKMNPKLQVLDVGASYNPWSRGFTTAVVDIFQPNIPDVRVFLGDANLPWVWDEVYKYVQENGKVDFCICTHTLEDLANPQLSIAYMPEVAKGGFIAIPSKYMEMKRNVFKFRGSIHHRWIFNDEDGTIVAYPKVSFLEWESKFDVLADKCTMENRELQFFWDATLPIKTVNEGYLGPSDRAVFGYYDGLLKGEL